MKILCCGDREWDDLQLIYDTLMEYPDFDYLIEGEAKGADKLSVSATEAIIDFYRERRPEKTFDIEILKFPAEWSKYGLAAGPIRNQKMLDEGKPDLVIAFHDDLDSSRGTRDMVKRALKQGFAVRLVHHA